MLFVYKVGVVSGFIDMISFGIRHYLRARDTWPSLSFFCPFSDELDTMLIGDSLGTNLSTSQPVLRGYRIPLTTS